MLPGVSTSHVRCEIFLKLQLNLSGKKGSKKTAAKKRLDAVCFSVLLFKRWWALFMTWLVRISKRSLLKKINLARIVILSLKCHEFIIISNITGLNNIN